MHTPQASAAFSAISTRRNMVATPSAAACAQRRCNMVATPSAAAALSAVATRCNMVATPSAAATLSAVATRRNMVATPSAAAALSAVATRGHGVVDRRHRRHDSAGGNRRGNAHFGRTVEKQQRVPGASRRKQRVLGCGWVREGGGGYTECDPRCRKMLG
jgi:hypothetical protein